MMVFPPSSTGWGQFYHTFRDKTTFSSTKLKKPKYQRGRTTSERETTFPDTKRGEETQVRETTFPTAPLNGCRHTPAKKRGRRKPPGQETFPGRAAPQQGARRRTKKKELSAQIFEQNKIKNFPVPVTCCMICFYDRPIIESKRSRLRPAQKIINRTTEIITQLTGNIQTQFPVLRFILGDRCPLKSYCLAQLLLGK
jgi:hypothetical protein